jgi:hypothetical protein
METREGIQMAVYTVTQDGTQRDVEAESVEDAARLIHAGARRTTGDRGLSGYFQGYVPCAGSGIWNVTSDGDPFHVG